MNSTTLRYRCFLIAFCVLVLQSVTSTVRSEEVTEPPKISVELVEPGIEPRRAIRFTPELGAKQSAEMIIDMQQKVSLGGTAMPSQTIPPQKMIIETEVTEVAANGDISFQFEYTDMKVVDDPNNPSPIAATMEQMLAPMIGATGNGVVTNRGLTRKGKLNIPEGLAPQLKNMLEGMKDAMNRLSSPVPEEAIGKGAQWKVVQRLVANGMTLTQTSTHTITDMTEDGFEMSIALDQNADGQQIENPMLPAGTKLNLDSLDSTGSGTTTVVAGSIFPTNSNVSMNTVANMSINVAGQDQKMKTEMTMKMSLRELVE